MNTHATPCPYCGAVPGQPCSTRTGQPARQPHAARQQAAEAAEATDLPVTTIGQALALTDTDDDRQLTIGSLFSGYGGLDLAVEQVTGARPVWFVEFDDAPSKILHHHWPDVPNYGDVTAVQWDEVPRVDVLTGGSPCQDLSQAGKRAGMSEGTRSNLWINMREAISTIRPRLVVWENVQGALSAKAESDSDMEQDGRPVGDRGGGHLRALGRVLGDLAEIGYDAAWTTVRASDVGAPHHRARVFLIATPTDPQGGGSVTVHDRPGCPPACREGDGWADGGYRREDASHPHVLGSQAGHQRPVGPGKEIPVTDGGGEAFSHPVGAGRHERVGAVPGEASCGRALGEPDRRYNRVVEWGEYAPAVRRWERVVGPAPAPTEINRNGRPRLAASFAEWMMGLPAGWVTGVPGLSRADQLKAIGNGVCPQQAAWAITDLLQQPA